MHVTQRPTSYGNSIGLRQASHPFMPVALAIAVLLLALWADAALAAWAAFGALAGYSLSGSV